MRCLLATTMLMLLGGCNSPQHDFTNENLLQDFPLPNGEWSSFPVENERLLKITWKKKDSKDFAITYVWYGLSPKIMELKEAIDNGAEENCDKFSTDTLSELPSNGYPSVVWKSRCHIGGKLYMTALNKMIVGNDSTYVLNRVWREEPEEQDWNSWLEYMEEVTVCDSRGDQHPCPDGYKKSGYLEY